MVVYLYKNDVKVCKLVGWIYVSLKIFRCRCCGAKVTWSATSCKVCNHLVSNDRAKRRIVLGCIAVIVFVLVEEWKKTAQQIFQMEDISKIFRQIYHGYMDSKEVIKVMDERYGDGSCVFVGKAMAFNDNPS